MAGSETIINILGIISTAAIIALAVMNASKLKKIQDLQKAVDNLNESLNEMDEQAKMVVRTDMELNKTQEELDKKIIGLYALQRLSRAISTTLEENQIFNMLNSTYIIEDLGFEKYFIFLWSEIDKKFKLSLNIGYAKDESKAIEILINNNKDDYLKLIASQETISSVQNKSADNFKVHSFVITGLYPKEGAKGFLFAGTENKDIVITEGDQELITILANQLAQALENARLFEKTWGAQQELERRVEKRTRELSLALEEVKKISRRKSDFVSSVTHELRTPLTSIKGYASILLTEKLGALPPEVKARLEKMNRHSDELAQMVNDLLDISRIESGKVTMKLETQSLKTIVQEASELLMVQLKDKQISLTVNIASGIDNILADLSQIKRVFINIIGNAIKFTPEQGKIIICAQDKGENIQIDVTDTGCGIPENARELIFEEFYRAENAVNEGIKGTGLGLALVKNIIEAHSGKIWVTSLISSGSTFSFTLPKGK
ncbi:MAG: ATP-binding protein [Candidatus Omnitrophota bacterium]